MPPRKRAPAKGKLRAATEVDAAKAAADAATKATKATTLKAAVDDSERGLLVAMRGKIAAEIDAGVPAHTLAGLMRQLRDLDREIRVIDAREEAERDDEREAQAGDSGEDVEPFDPASQSF